jgi:phenylacetate-CoA ligase
VRALLYPAHEWLKRKPTFAWLRRLERTQWLPWPELRDLQLRRLRAHLAWARDHAPYYREQFRAHGIDPAAIRGVEDLARIPYLTRETLRARFDDLTARARLPRVQRLTTGGSTGIPVPFLVDAERMGVADAIRLRAHGWFGLEPGAREVVLWGSPIELGRQDRVRALRDRLVNSVLLSAFDLGEPSLDRHLRAIGRWRPAKMYGYASALHLLARRAIATGWRPPAGLRAVFTTAEPLFDFQRSAIAEAFGCAVATEYGARDAGLIANECPAGSLHVPAEGIVVEVDAAPGQPGEIVVTNLYSAAFPLIRYRTGDVGCLEPAPCPCGRSLPRLRSVEGRLTDFLVTPDGRVLHALSVIYVLRDAPGVGRFRVVQRALDDVVVLVVPDGRTRPDGAGLASRVERVLGRGVRVAVEEVAHIPVTGSGKFRHVVSEVAEANVGGLPERAR